MNEKLLHTPQGVRDIYNLEWKKKDAVIRRLRRVLSLFGYQDISTPAFEFFDIFNSDTGTVPSQAMFKFFDRNNNTLVLRPDMTPAIARSAAKYYSDCSFPLRLSYEGNTFINHVAYQGKLTEKTELGVEHINDDSPEADAEAVIMMIDCLLEAGLTEFCVDIGNAAYYRSIMQELPVDDEVKARIHDHIENRNALAMELLLDEENIHPAFHKVLIGYNELFGDVSILEKAEKLAPVPACKEAIARLREVYRVICMYGYERYIRFDMGMVNHYDYYTGIIFQGYTYGTGDAIGKGGRYDNLLAKFGMKAPAIGFTILVDDLMAALDRQKIPVSIKDYGYTVLLYDKEDQETAISLASGMRMAGVRTEMICRDPHKDQEDYESFVRDMGADNMAILSGGQVIIRDFINRKHEKKSLEEFREEY